MQHPAWQGRGWGKPTRGNMKDSDKTEIEETLVRLREEHRDLDDAIKALIRSGASDRLQLQSLKKMKLFIKDEITKLEDRLLPDIIA